MLLGLGFRIAMPTLEGFMTDDAVRHRLSAFEDGDRLRILMAFRTPELPTYESTMLTGILQVHPDRTFTIDCDGTIYPIPAPARDGYSYAYSKITAIARSRGGSQEVQARPLQPQPVDRAASQHVFASSAIEPEEPTQQQAPRQVQVPPPPPQPSQVAAASNQPTIGEITTLLTRVLDFVAASALKPALPPPPPTPAFDADAMRVLGQAQRGEDRQLLRLAPGLTMVAQIERDFRPFCMALYLEEGPLAPRAWRADLTATKLALGAGAVAFRETRGPKSGPAAPAAQGHELTTSRFAESQFEGLIPIFIAQPPTTKEEWYVAFAAGAALLASVATIRFGFNLGGHRVITAFNNAWEKGFIDWRALWNECFPRRV